MSVEELNLGVLGPYLEAHVPEFAGLQGAEKFSGGQSNPTFLITANSGRYVLRRQPHGELLPSAHAVDREYRVISALRGSGVPVPQALHLCEDREVIGSLFYVMSFVDGVLFWNAALPDLDKDQRRATYDEMIHVMARLHDIDVNELGLADYGRPGNYFERQVTRWSKQYRASETETIEAMDRLMDWLPVNMPPDDGKVSLIHGDFRIDNIIFHHREQRALALLDWELSTLGHPYADLAYQCMQLRMSPDSVIAGLCGVDRGRLGIPTEGEYVAQYCALRGLAKIPHWNFYLVFSFFRLAAILQGVLKRSIEGNASSKLSFEYGALAPVLAAEAVKLLDQG